MIFERVEMKSPSGWADEGGNLRIGEVERVFMIVGIVGKTWNFSGVLEFLQLEQ